MIASGETELSKKNAGLASQKTFPIGTFSGGGLSGSLVTERPERILISGGCSMLTIADREATAK